MDPPSAAAASQAAQEVVMTDGFKMTKHDRKAASPSTEEVCFRRKDGSKRNHPVFKWTKTFFLPSDGGTHLLFLGPELQSLLQKMSGGALSRYRWLWTPPTDKSDLRPYVPSKDPLPDSKGVVVGISLTNNGVTQPTFINHGFASLFSTTLSPGGKRIFDRDTVRNAVFNNVHPFAGDVSCSVKAGKNETMTNENPLHYTDQFLYCTTDPKFTLAVRTEAILKDIKEAQSGMYVQFNQGNDNIPGEPILENREPLFRLMKEVLLKEVRPAWNEVDKSGAPVPSTTGFASTSTGEPQISDLWVRCTLEQFKQAREYLKKYVESSKDRPYYATGGQVLLPWTSANPGSPSTVDDVLRSIANLEQRVPYPDGPQFIEVRNEQGGAPDLMTVWLVTHKVTTTGEDGVEYTNFVDPNEQDIADWFASPQFEEWKASSAYTDALQRMPEWTSDMSFVSNNLKNLRADMERHKKFDELIKPLMDLESPYIPTDENLCLAVGTLLPDGSIAMPPQIEATGTVPYTGRPSAPTAAPSSSDSSPAPSLPTPPTPPRFSMDACIPLTVTIEMCTPWQ